MDARVYNLLLTLVAVVAVAVLSAGCDDAITGPAFGPAALIHPAPAEIAPVECAIEAIVTAVEDTSSLLGGSIAVGDSVVGWFRYDENADDIDNKPNRGKYLFDAAPAGMSVVIAGQRFYSDAIAPALTIRLDNAEPGDVKRDAARFSSTANHADLPGVEVADMTILLTDLSAAALSSDALAGTDPYHSEWPTKRQFTISGAAGWRIVAEIATFAEPGSEEPPDPPESTTKIKFHQE